LASSIRAKTGKPVIDPSALTEGSWKQEQWGEFWCQVISQFTEAVVLASEWEFSKGACSECLFALRDAGCRFEPCRVQNQLSVLQ